MLQARTLNVIFYKTISVQGIFDWLRQHSEQFNTYHTLEIFKDDAEVEWGRTTYRFLKCHHPDKLQPFFDARAKLGDSQDKEWWSYLHALECSGYHRCKEPVCPMCQLIQEEEVAAALTKA